MERHKEYEMVLEEGDEENGDIQETVQRANMHDNRVDSMIMGPTTQRNTDSENKLPPAKSQELIDRENREKKIAKAKATVNAILEHKFVSGLTAVFTFWALFNYDIKLASTDKDADSGFEIIISIVFFAFILEIFAQIFCKPDYVKFRDWPERDYDTMWSLWTRRLRMPSFYFWLDWLATLSLILEMGWIIGSQEDEMHHGDGLVTLEAGKDIRLGARAGRIVRLIRMARLMRMAKLIKYYASNLKDNEKLKTVNSANATIVTADAIKDEDESGQEESRVGAAMSDIINQRVIMLVLLLLVIIPVVVVHDDDTSNKIAANIIGDLATHNYLDTSVPPLYQDGLNLAISETMSRLDVLHIRFNDQDQYADYSTMKTRRSIEMDSYALSMVSGFNVYITFDYKKHIVEGALYSIYTTIFIIFLLVIGTIAFNFDVIRLVINPIERLVELVRKISKNPLGVEYKMLGADEGFIEGMETTVLLATITKIGLLMRVGFGEAGAAIIAKNMSNGTGKLNLMGGGTRIMAIFGFCDVRQFTDTTECLQEEVMLFVNRIAHILHSIVVQCSGAANKNIGDAFLLTWKVEDRYNSEQRALLADQALLAFCKALIELSRYQDFICNFSVAATARLYKRFPEYNVRIGSGLHYGWAVEGAIGSGKKIDASYLSPNVNTSEFLESSTKAYGVPLLLSEPFFKLLSPVAARYCRQVDRIRRSAAEEPMGLYAYDADLNINWNDSSRHVKKDAKSRMAAAKIAAHRATQLETIYSTGDAATSGSAASLKPKFNTKSKFKSLVNKSVEMKRKDEAANPPKVPAGIPGPGAGPGVGGLPGGGANPKSKFKNLIQAQMEEKRRLGHDGKGNPLPGGAAAKHGRRASSVGGLPPIATRPTHVGPGGSRPSVVIPGGLQSLNLGHHARPGLGGISEMEEKKQQADIEAAEKAKNDRKTVAPTIVVPPYTMSVWEDDTDIVELRHQVNDSFRALWENGIASYIKGDWQKARDIFHETMTKSKGKDGPSKFLMDIIDSHGGTAPHDWPGYRTEGGGH